MNGPASNLERISKLEIRMSWFLSSRASVAIVTACKSLLPRIGAASLEVAGRASNQGLSLIGHGRPFLFDRSV